MRQIKKLITRKLIKSNFNFDDIDLDEIIGIYNNLMDYTLEDCYKDHPKDSFDPRFWFAITPRIMLDETDNHCFEIFKYLILLKRYNLLHLLDYGFLAYFFDGTCTYVRYRIESLYNYLKAVNKLYNENKDNFTEAFTDYWNNVIDCLVDDCSDSIEESKIFPQYYKDILEVYAEISNDYYETDEYDDLEDIEADINFGDFIELSYTYLLLSGLLTHDNPDVLEFLTRIRDNLPRMIESLYLAGCKDQNELYAFIDSLYKDSKNKVKVIK